MMALQGIRMLDLSHRYPGAISAMMLGDFGAEVIKIDSPVKTQTALPDFPEEKFAAYFAPDRNKRTVTLDLKSPGDLSLFYELIKTSDVVIEGFRPGVMTRLKADYNILKEMNPRLVYCSLVGYGQDGPFASLPGHDPNYIGIGGLLSLIGPKGGPPYLPSNIGADMVVGLYGAMGVLLALQARTVTGKGQFVDVGYLNATVSLLHYEAFQYFLTGIVPRRGETYLSGDAPFVQVLKCKDGEYFTISCTELHLWENLCRALDRPDLIPYQYPKDAQKKAEVIRDLEKIFLTRTRDEWFEYLKDKNVCVGPVNWLNEAFQFPQVLHNRMVIEVDHPTLGKVKQLGIPMNLSETPGSVRFAGRPVGADNEEILGPLKSKLK